jgi:hypothetical protein
MKLWVDIGKHSDGQKSHILPIGLTFHRFSQPLFVSIALVSPDSVRNIASLKVIDPSIESLLRSLLYWRDCGERKAIVSSTHDVFEGNLPS